MFIKNKILLVASAIIVSVLSAIIFHSSLSAQTLSETLELAYKNNPSIQSQRATLRNVNEGIPQARGGWRPSVNLNAKAGWLKPDYTNKDKSRNYHTAGLGITQNIYAGGATEASIKKAEAKVLGARARLHSVEQKVLLEVVSAYMNVLRDQSVLELNIQNEARLQRQLEASRDRFDVGEVTRTDVAQAESRVSRAQAERIAAEGTLDVSRANFKQLVGQEPNGLLTPNVDPELPTALNEAVILSQSKNPDINAVRSDRDAAFAEIDIQQADLRPSIDLSGDAGYNYDVARQNFSGTNLAVAAGLTIPLYQAGVSSSQVRQAKQRVGALNRQIEDITRKTVEAATTAWKTLQTEQARIVSFKDGVRATSIALDGVEQEAAVGLRTVLDVLDAEQELLDARVNLVRSKRDEIVARYALLSAVGGLTVRDLDLAVEIYDETAHYDDIKNKIWGLDNALNVNNPPD